MDKNTLLAEILEQRPKFQIDPEQGVLYERIAVIGDIAWQALAGPPSGERRETMLEVAAAVRCRSENPRTILRRLIRNAQEQHGYVPGEKVRKAAGLATPRSN